MAATRSLLDVDRLRRDVKGRVIVPDDPDYHQARQVFSGAIDRFPAAIVRVADADDISHLVGLAAETGIELAVRSGGHSNVGHGTTDGGLVIDLSAMKGLEIDLESRQAWAETGLTAAQYTEATSAHGLATGFGDTGSVGIGGLTLGGGVGYLVRKYGLTIDSLLGAEMVTADGRRLTVDADSHPDLFWAIRGGGGNFGVATRFHVRLHPVDPFVGGMMILPVSTEVVAGFMEAAEAAPEELTTILNVMAAPPMPMIPSELHGELIAMALMAYAGDPETGERALAPFRALATPIVDMVQAMPYAQIYPPEEEEYRPTAAGDTMFMDRIDREAAETIVQYLRESDAAVRVAQLRVLGGAMARVPEEATAFAHRRRRIMVNLAAFYEGPEDRLVREAWVAEFAAALPQDDDSAAYVNFLVADHPEQVRRAYPERTWERLREVKHRYDPTNLFRLNFNIPPA